MNLSEISIRNHVFAWMLMLGLLIFGGLAFQRMGVSQLPNVDFPTVSVSVSLDGAAPEVMELDVVDPIEGALATIPGIKSLSSSASTGSARISAEFDLSKDIDVAVQEIQSALSRAMRRLPTDIDPPTVHKSNPDDQPILWLSVTSDTLSRRQLMTLVRDQVQDRFSTIDGVGEVNLSGYLEPNLRVWLDQAKLNRYQLTAADVVSTIQREHNEQPGGRIENPERELNIRTLGEAISVKDFENIAISRRGGSINYRPIPLKSVARVEDGTADVRSISRAQGKVSVSIGITKQPGSNAVKVAQAVKERIREVQSQLPENVEIATRFDNTQFIEEAVHELNFNLVFSAVLTALVCWLFLGSLSATFNVVLAIPTSVVGSFIILNALGFTLNTFTLLGLSLAIGIVVDDAIMVLENIVRHKELGKSRLQASLDGSREITGAAIAATIAIIAIFLPVAFMDGVIGRYFLQFGVTLSVAVAISLLEALTLTPMRTSRFLVVEERRTRIGRAVEAMFQMSSRLYGKIIPYTLKYPFVTIGLAGLFFAGSLYIGKFLKQEFVPPQDQSRLMVRVRTPVGSSLTYTDERMKEVENYFASRPEVLGQFSTIGGGQANSGFVFLTLKPAREREKNALALAMEYRRDLRKLKDVQANIIDPSMNAMGVRGRGGGTPVSFSLRGPDWEKLVNLSQQMTAAMDATGLMTDVDTNHEEGLPEVQIVPDRVKARNYGVDVSEISQTVRVMMAGAIAGKYSEGSRRYDVRVGLPPDGRASIETLKIMNVRNNRGELIPLANVVTIEEKSSLQSISREDRQRSINVRANVAPGSSQAEAITAVQKISKEMLPVGYFAVVSGNAKTFQESFTSLIFALVLGIVVSYMVLASQFNSFIHPVTILIALPFSISGAFLALWVGGQTLNIYSMIGLILLMGIVKKNSILLVEFTNQVRERSDVSVKEALTEACPIRLRPILMTSVATIAAAIPPAFALGPGAESMIPMALAVIGGVVVSTVMTLFVVPSVYLILDRFETTKKEHVSKASSTARAG